MTTAAKTGRLLVLKQDVGAGSYESVAGMRTNSITLNNESVDITNKDSVNGSDKLFRELLEKGGMQTVSISGEAVFVDATTYETFRDRALGNTHHSYRVEIPGASTAAGGYYQGTFMIASHDLSGGYNDSVTYNLTLESAGEVTFTSGDIV